MPTLPNTGQLLLISNSTQSDGLRVRSAEAVEVPFIPCAARAVLREI
jgi:hypothetical protein